MTTVEHDHAAPPGYVAPLTPEGKRFGLFSIATVDTDPALRWETGLEWEPLPGQRAGLLSTVCDDPAGLPLVANEMGDPVTALPFAVHGSYLCSAFSRPLDEAENRARQHLALGEERAVEYAIAVGGFDNAPLLSAGVNLTPAGGPASVVVGLALLEEHLGVEYAGAGAIHAPRLVAGRAWSHGGVRRHGQRLETPVGTPVAFGGGYDAASPGDGTAWLYASGRPVVRRSEVWVTPDEDHRLSTARNDVEVYAHRLYLAGWDGPAARVLVALDET